ncbi:MAG TPA: hypothetical protein VIK78_16620 [Ruminiclostridium sp.]
MKNKYKLLIGTLVAVILIVLLTMVCIFTNDKISVSVSNNSTYIKANINDSTSLGDSNILNEDDPVPGISKDDFKAALTWDANIYEDGFLRNYIVKDNRYFYQFSKDGIIITFPIDGENTFTITSGEKRAVFPWKNTYYPGSSYWMTADLVDITGDGSKDLCVSISHGGGTGTTVSVIHVVDLTNMQEIPILDQNDAFILKDATTIMDFLTIEKTPQRSYSIMSVGLSDDFIITVKIAIVNYKESPGGVVVGWVNGEYIYTGDGFTLTHLKFAPEE